MDARLILAAAAVTAVACTQPKTDIIATSTEDVGRYEATTRAEGKDLIVQVCVADARHADEIARRIVEQVKSQWH